MTLDFKKIHSFEWLLDNLGSGVFAVNQKLEIIYFNLQAELLTGYSKHEAVGRKCWEIFRTNQCSGNCNLRRAMQEDSKVVNQRLRMSNRFGKEIPVVITAAVLHDNNGGILGGVESFHDDTAREALEKKVKNSYRLNDFVSQDRRVQEIIDRVRIIADSANPVLILGETGVGKDILARSVHNISRRSSGPFIKVNCAAIPASMLESELFGYKKGAFTDAGRDKPGKFQLASKGTILLDEIGEMTPDMQAKLLQVMEEKEFYPLGATRVEKVDVRIIATTNRDLGSMVQEGRFRKDLYYRLKLFEFEIPPLRERLIDIQLLIDHFLERSAAMNDTKVLDMGLEVKRILMQYDYPGNVRELKNIIEYVVMLSSGCVEKTDLPPYLQDWNQAWGFLNSGEQSWGKDLESAEREVVLDSLLQHNWQMQSTAESLGMSRTTLWRKMKRHRLTKKDS